MSYRSLLDRGPIKPFKATPAQIENQIGLARRDLDTAEKILDQDSDWAFNIAYNAILQATRGLIYSEGYRLSSAEGHHVAAIAFAQLALGDDFRDQVRFFRSAVANPKGSTLPGPLEYPSTRAQAGCFYPDLGGRALSFPDSGMGEAEKQAHYAFLLRTGNSKLGTRNLPPKAGRSGRPAGEKQPACALTFFF